MTDEDKNKNPEPTRPSQPSRHSEEPKPSDPKWPLSGVPKKYDPIKKSED